MREWTHTIVAKATAVILLFDELVDYELRMMANDPPPLEVKSVLDTLVHECYICEGGCTVEVGDDKPALRYTGSLPEAGTAYIQRPKRCRYWLARTPSGMYRVYDFEKVFTSGRPPWAESLVGEYPTKEMAITTTTILYSNE